MKKFALTCGLVAAMYAGVSLADTCSGTFRIDGTTKAGKDWGKDPTYQVTLYEQYANAKQEKVIESRGDAHGVAPDKDNEAGTPVDFTLKNCKVGQAGNTRLVIKISRELKGGKVGEEQAWWFANLCTQSWKASGNKLKVGKSEDPSIDFNYTISEHSFPLCN